jgi:plasmid rolling circle replication initiator protein Rep|tara:strand:- start:182 stop:415 length:234 start_codon:yes stop_codon:yes gene_type:complete
MKLYDIGVNDKGTILKLWVCDDDESNIREWRGSLKAVLQHVFSDLVLNDWDKVKPKVKWGYPRLNIKETMDLLEWRN